MRAALHRGLEVVAEGEVAAHHLGIVGHQRRAGGVHQHHEVDVGVGLHRGLQLGLERTPAGFAGIQQV